MKISHVTLIAVILSCFIPTLASAAPEVYPLREVFGFDAPELKEKASVFAQWSENRTKAALAEEFNADFRKKFGELAAKDVTDVNKHEVLVASLHLIRASQYVVPKLGLKEVHMPITLSIVITNPSTGEALYSFTKTSYAAANLASTDAITPDKKELVSQTASNYKSLLNTLINDVKEGYNPQKLDITVAKEWKGLYVLDKGSKHGIATGDSLTDVKGNELTVKHVSEGYAVAQSLLGKVDQGQKFFKYVTSSTTSQFAKPRVLTMHEGWKNIDLTNISRLFESEVSKESAFTLLPVNEYFRNLLEALARDTYSGKFETTQQRELPDYMLKFSAAKPRAFAMSEKGKFDINIYEQYILGELLDKQGRILFSAIGSNRIEDKNVAGMVFDKVARLEVVQKNAVVNLAEAFTRSIKFSHFVLPVKETDRNSIEVEDKSKELRIGQSATLFRNIGRIDGVSSDIVVPIWQASVFEANKGKVKMDLLLPLTDKGISVSRDDLIIIDAITAAATADQSETSVTYCEGELPKLGPVDFNDFDVVSRGYGYLLPYTLYDNDRNFSAMISKALREGGFKDSLKLGKVDTAGRCLLPVHKVSVDGKKCEAGKCNFDISLALGYRLYIGKERKGAVATNTKIKIEDCRENVQEPVIQCDLSKNALAPLKENIIKMQYKTN
jgi:hypothetical protein